MLTRWLLLPLLLAGCWSRDDWGDMTIINTGTTEFHATLDRELVVIAPGAHRNWRSTPTGSHQLVAADGTATVLHVARGRATVVDTTGTGCYVVGDYGNQYRPNSAGEVVILERFTRQPMFTPRHALLILYGEPLPTTISEGVHVRALAAVDCRIIDRDHEVVESIRRKP